MRPYTLSKQFVLLLAMTFSACQDSTEPQMSFVPLVQILQGNGQTGQVGQALPESLSIRLTDSSGRPLEGWRVRFQIEPGSGVVSPLEVATDESGVATTQWILGISSSGPHRVHAVLTSSIIDTVVVGSFEATPTTGTEQIAIISGDGQAGIPGAPLADSLVARVTDQYGNPIPGKPVLWNVYAGGGATLPYVDTSDAMGYVSTKVILNNQAGSTVIRASLTDENFVSFPVSAVGPNADIRIQVLAPQRNNLVSGSVSINTRVTSRYQLNTVTAIVGNQEIPLTYSSSTDRWTGAISFSGQPFGPNQLVIKAIDVENGESVYSVPLQHDAPPRLNILSPEPYTVTSSSVRIHVTCEDVDVTGCTYLRALAQGADYSPGAGPGYLPATILGTSVSSIDVIANLPHSGLIYLEFVAQDAARQMVTQQRKIVVYKAANSSLVDAVPGIVKDVRGNRILFTDTLETILKIRTVGSGDVTIFQQPNTLIGSAYLTSNGAIFLKKNTGDLFYTITEYRNGIITEFVNRYSTTLMANENYAIWYNGGTFVLRDLSTGTNTTFGTNAGETDITDMGDVAYRVQSQIMFRPYGGSPVQVTNDVGIINAEPLTDGTRVVYRKTVSTSSGQRHKIALWNSVDGEIILGSERSGSISPYYYYAINNGWVAYTQPGTAGELQVWSYSPSKTAIQVSSFGSSSTIDGLGRNGEIIFTNSGERYISLPPYSSKRKLERSAAGQIFWRDGDFLVFIEGAVFRQQ